MQTHFANAIIHRTRRLALPLGVYAGLNLTGASVLDAVTNPAAQAELALAVHERYHTEVLLTAMDLSAEAEAYGCQVIKEEDEIPTVVGRRAASLADVQALPDPQPGDARTAMHLAAAGLLANSGTRLPVLCGLIGPFSLAGRIFGVSEALEATAADPEPILALLEKTTRFLIDYALAFREVGAGGVLVAEPAAGLLSPRGLARFSAPYVRQIVDAVQREDFTLVLHNCGARPAHLPKVLESGAEIYHFGAPMNLLAALEQVPGDVILCGNLDPSAVFVSASPEQVWDVTRALLNDTCARRNFVISSGCDLPPGVPDENLQAFFEAVQSAGLLAG